MLLKEAYMIVLCGGLTLAAHQLPTKAALALTSSAGQEKGLT